MRKLPGGLDPRQIVYRVSDSGPLQREMDFRNTPAVPARGKLAHCVALANQLKESPHGSSAGGEQPKFLSLCEDVGHVIVKFAKQGTCMADLLPLEHPALRTLVPWVCPRPRPAWPRRHALGWRHR